MNKEELIKSLEEAGHRESALLLQNWGEMDSLAKSLLEKAKPTADSRAQRHQRLKDELSGKAMGLAPHDRKNPVSGKGMAVHSIGPNKIRAHYDNQGTSPSDFEPKNFSVAGVTHKIVGKGKAKDGSHYFDVEHD